jgi:hypothetical protein
MIEPAMIEVSGMISIEERTIVLEIDPVAIVTAPGRIVIISISGEIGFDDGGSGIVARGGYRRTNVNPGGRNTETNMRADEYLRIAFSSDEAGGYNGGKDK